MDKPVLLTVEQFAARLQLGRTRVFELLAAGDIRSIKLGRSRRIPVAEVDRYVSRLLAEQNGDWGEE